MLRSAPDAPIRGVFLSYSLRCLGRSSPWHRVHPRTIQSGGYCLASCLPGCCNPGRLFIVFSPLPRTLPSVAPGSPPDDPVWGLVPCFFLPRMLRSGPSFYRILSVASDAPVHGTGFTPGRSSPGASAVLHSSPDAPLRGVFLSFCRTLAAASDAPVRGAGFTPGRSSPGARAVLSLGPDAPIRDVMFLALLADFGVCVRGALVFCMVFFFARPSSLLLPRSPRSTLLSPPFPLPLRPRSSLPLLPFSPFVVALFGHALKLLVPTRACCYVLGQAHTFVPVHCSSFCPVPCRLHFGLPLPTSCPLLFCLFRARTQAPTTTHAVCHHSLHPFIHLFCTLAARLLCVSPRGDTVWNAAANSPLAFLPTVSGFL